MIARFENLLYSLLYSICWLIVGKMPKRVRLLLLKRNRLSFWVCYPGSFSFVCLVRRGFDLRYFHSKEMWLFLSLRSRDCAKCTFSGLVVLSVNTISCEERQADRGLVSEGIFFRNATCFFCFWKLWKNTILENAMWKGKHIRPEWTRISDK